MKSKTPFLDFYRKYNRSGHLPNHGLCSCFGPDDLYELIKIFEPTVADRCRYGIVTDHWGLEIVGRYAEKHEYDVFSDLRKTIVLFCAAINNEL